MKIILVIPCYNEADRLPTAEIDGFVRAKGGQVRVILVNDGSYDATGTVITALAASNPDILALSLAKNCGKAEAVRQGVQAALREECDWVGFWDADMATPLNELDHFLSNQQRNNYDVVVGCRLARLGANIKREPIRHYLGRLFATTVSSLLRLPLYDSQCGAKIFRRELAAQVFSRPFVSRWLFDVEIFRRIVLLYGREKTIRMIYECPLYQWLDVKGSKLTKSKMLKTPIELWKIFHS